MFAFNYIKTNKVFTSNDLLPLTLKTSNLEIISLFTYSKYGNLDLLGTGHFSITYFDKELLKSFIFTLL